ncbi:hypothetical protein WH218_15760 [Stenotrophomonas indicatrix]|uniref:hypothetical protein n=1 Tax=Stenotrophomonas indicatrix TaxID=2045451 RepID=UPI001EE62CFE|nr:hypothetical protein [Stenotrophomonas indicatrix]
MSDTPSPTSSPLFLPLREQSLLRHLSDGTPPDTPLEQAGLLVAMLCRRQRPPATQLQRLLHDACALFAADDGPAAQAQLAASAGQDARALEAWLGVLAAQDVLLAPDEVMEAVLAASPDAYPGADFQTACRITLEEHTIHFRRHRWPKAMTKTPAMTNRPRMRPSTTACSLPNRHACCVRSRPIPMN